MEDIPKQRASNPFRNQGYMMRLSRSSYGRRRRRDQVGEGLGRRRRRRRQMGGSISALTDRMKNRLIPGYKFAKSLTGKITRALKKFSPKGSIKSFFIHIFSSFVQT